jgi:hypothetical protein
MARPLFDVSTGLDLAFLLAGVGHPSHPYYSVKIALSQYIFAAFAVFYHKLLY